MSSVQLGLKVSLFAKKVVFKAENRLLKTHFWRLRTPDSCVLLYFSLVFVMEHNTTDKAKSQESAE